MVLPGIVEWMKYDKPRDAHSDPCPCWKTGYDFLWADESDFCIGVCFAVSTLMTDGKICLQCYILNTGTIDFCLCDPVIMCNKIVGGPGCYGKRTFCIGRTNMTASLGYYHLVVRGLRGDDPTVWNVCLVRCDRGCGLNFKKQSATCISWNTCLCVSVSVFCEVGLVLWLLHQTGYCPNSA